MPKYSLVVPAYNEEKALPLFYEAVVPVMESLNEDFEMIFINDGSRDKTKEILTELAARDKRVKVCCFPQFRATGGAPLRICRGEGRRSHRHGRGFTGPSGNRFENDRKMERGLRYRAREAKPPRGGNCL